MQVARVGIHIKQARHDLPGRSALLHVGQCGNAIVHIVARVQLMKLQHRPIVLRDHLRRSRREIHGDFRSACDHIHRVQRFIMLADIIEAFGGPFVVVERNAGGDTVDEGHAFVLQRRLDQRHKLSLVAGEAASHEGRTQLQRHAYEVDGLIAVDRAALGLGTLVRRR